MGRKWSIYSLVREKKKMTFFKPNIPIPLNYEKTPTDDGSFTLKSLNFNENCHSTSGANEETIYNYILGTGVNNLTLPLTNIFEVGFGLGVGAILSFMEAKKQKKKINFFSMEIDENLIHWFKNSVSDELNELFPFNNLVKANDLFYSATGELGELVIFVGDAFKNKIAIQNEINQRSKINKIYQDAFSPKRNPDLWTIEWFEFLKSISAGDVLLSTYSASHGFRKNLKQLGFFVYNKKGFAQKRSMTIASLSKIFREDLDLWP